MWFFVYNSLILTTGCSTCGTPWQRTLRIWELELLLSTKIAEAIRSSVTAWNWVAVGGQGHTEVFQDWFHSEQASQGLIKEVESLCCASGAELGIKKQMHECCQHCFRGCRSGRSACQWSDHTPHTAKSQFAWPSSHKEAGSQKTCKQFAEDNLAKSTSYWNHVLWFDESELNLFDSDGVQHVWWRPGEEYQENCALPTVKRGGGSIMVWGCMTTAGAGELRLIEGNMDSNMYCDTLKQKMMPSLQKLFSNITSTPNTPPRWHCLAAEGEGDWVAKYDSRPETNWAHVEHPQAGGEAPCV